MLLLTSRHHQSDTLAVDLLWVFATLNAAGCDADKINEEKNADTLEDDSKTLSFPLLSSARQQRESETT